MCDKSYRIPGRQSDLHTPIPYVFGIFGVLCWVSGSTGATFDNFYQHSLWTTVIISIVAAWSG
jgi:hypothetical protein